MSIIYFTKEVSKKFNILEREAGILARHLGVSKVFGSYRWLEKDIKKLEQFLKWKK